MKTITLADGRQLTYELERKCVKNINFRAKPDGIVYVSASPRVSVREIEKYLNERADFFLNAFKRLGERERKGEISTEYVRWLGKEYPVRVIENSRETAVIDANECRVFTRLGFDADYVLNLIKRTVSERFMQLCTEINAEVLGELSQYGLVPPPTTITVKDMRSRWGSCSYYKGHISINVRLAAYPRETTKSVFWHEYAHYWHHDHSAKFYAFLNKYCPDYNKWNAVLKK